MKKSFKRFLSSVLATVMAVAGMSIGMTTTAMAAESVTWISDGTTAAPDVLGAQYGENTVTFDNNKTTASLSGFTFADETNTVYGKTGINVRSGLTTAETGLASNADRYIFFTPTQDGTMSLFLVNNASGNTSTIRLFKATKSDTGYSFTLGSDSDDVMTDINGVSLYDAKISGYAVANITPIEFAVTAGTSYALYGNAANIALMGVIFEPAGTYTGSITGTVTYSGDTPTGTFKCGTTAFTLNEDGTYTVPALADGDYEITYTGIDYSMDSVTVTVADQGATTQNLTLSAPKVYTWTLDTSNVTLSLEGTLTLGSDETTNSLVNTLSYSGSDYTLVNTYATLTADESSSIAKLDGTTVTVTVTDDWFVAAAEAQTITDKATLTFTSADNITASEDMDKVYCDYFKLHFSVGSNSASAIDGSNKTVAGLGSYTTRFKTAGTAGNISFTVSGPATLQVVCYSSSSSATRTLQVRGGESGSYSQDIEGIAGTGDVVLTPLLSLPEGGTYTLNSASGGLNFYSVNVVVGSIEDVTAADGEAFFDIADGYMIANVSDNDVNTYNSFTITANGKTVTDYVVYAAALIDGHLIKASDLGVDYIYVVKGNNAVTNSNTDALKNFTVDFTSSNE